MAGPFRWIKRAAFAAMLLAALTPRLHAQTQEYLFNYFIYGGFTSGGNGSPYSDLLCSGTTSSINYDANPATHNAKITDLCPAVQAPGINYGAQFAAYVFTFTPIDVYNFYVGSADGSTLYIDGQDVLDNLGPHGYTGNTVSVSLGVFTHTFLLDFYAGSTGDPFAKTVQAIVDPRLNVSTFDPTLLFHGPPPLFPTTTPEPSSLILAVTGLALLAGVVALRRRRTQH